METILGGVLEVGGVTAAMVLDANGRLVGHCGRAIYDRATCEQVGGRINKTIESIALQQEDWDTITAQFTDGRLLLRRLGSTAAGRRHVLAVIADSSLNASFATVAIRVAANKLAVALESGPPTLGRTSAPSSTAAAPVPGPSESRPKDGPAASQPALARTGLTWSTPSSAGSSVASVSGVAVADAASATFLSRCAKELARHVGPMAKVYVQEAVRRVAPDAAFSVALARELREELAGQIDDPRARAHFVKALEKA